MKPIALYFCRLLLLSCTLVMTPSWAKDSPVNHLKIAPDFVIKTPLRLSDLKGKVIYLDFWASWCGPCRKSFPWLNQLSQRYPAKDLVVLSVNLDSEIALAQQFLKQFPAEFSVTYNPEGDIAERYQVLGMPSSYLIDRQGHIAFSHVGFFTSKIATYQQQIEHLIAQP